MSSLIKKFGVCRYPFITRRLALKWTRTMENFCIIPISKKYCSDTVDIVPITGYTIV